MLLLVFLLLIARWVLASFLHSTYTFCWWKLHRTVTLVVVMPIRFQLIPELLIVGNFFKSLKMHSPPGFHQRSTKPIVVPSGATADNFFIGQGCPPNYLCLLSMWYLLWLTSSGVPIPQGFAIGVLTFRVIGQLVAILDVIKSSSLAVVPFILRHMLLSCIK